MNLPGDLAQRLGKHASEIDHLAIAVPDLESAVQFYSDVLGFKMTERRETKGRKTAMVSAVMEAGTVTFVLVQGTTKESQVSRYIDHYGPGVQHVAIRVEDLDVAVEELKQAGMAFDTTIIHSPGLRQIFTRRDPASGMMIELIQRVDEEATFSDQGVQQLFDQLEANDSF